MKKILVLMILIISLVPINTYASSGTYGSYDDIDGVPTGWQSHFSSVSVSEYPYVVVYKKSTGAYTVVISQQKFQAKIGSSSTIKLYKPTGASNFTYITKSTNTSATAWTGSAGWYDGFDSDDAWTWSSFTTSEPGFIASNYDIKNHNHTSVFFSKRGFLTPLKEALQNQTLTTPLVVGLVLFSIGLWIVWVAFSKGWQFLSKVLRTA